MNSPIVKIHEFSTGIQAEKTPDGGWVSRGFTGQYINRTLDPIPAAVQSAISNREFAVAEGASRDNPAIIGREVSGGGEDWSVIAVVTRGGDDRGRSASMYRYFLCEGAGNLWKILAWIESERKAGQMPVFNPFDTKFIGQPNEYQADDRLEIPLKKELQYLLANEAPIVIPSGQPCTASIVDRMATEKAKENGQPIAWAFQVEALEQPRSFLVIQPASEKAEQLLQKAMAIAPQYTAPIPREYEIKSAIKGSISRDKVKPEQVEVIETSINQVKDSDWEVIFNGQGSSQALKQGIYSPQMVRLLTLRAIVIPQTLPEFLDWMQKREKQEEHYQVSEALQSEITSFFTQNSGQPSYILSKVNEGVLLIIPHLIDRPELLNPTVWLLNAPSGIWSKFYARLRQNIKNELIFLNPRFSKSQKHQSTIDDDRWKKLFNELKVYCQNRSYPPDDKYLPLAELFSGLDEAELAAFFYQVSLGNVPKKIFSQLDREDGNSSVLACGLRVKKQVSVAEFLLISLIQIGLKKMPIALVIVLLVLTFIGGVWSGGALKGSKKPGESPASFSENSQPSDLPGIPNRERGLPEDAPQVSKPAELDPNNLQIEPEYQDGMNEKRFKATIKSLDKIIKEVREKNSGKSNEDILTALKQVLYVPDLNYDGAKNDDHQEQIKLVKAIHSYQKQFNTQPGYIDDSTKQTIRSLKQDIEDRL